MLAPQAYGCCLDRSAAPRARRTPSSCEGPNTDTVERVLPQPTPGDRTDAGWLSRLLDGAHPWGSFDATVGRYGVRRYRLIIYPPGTSTADRRLARLWRGWPITGAALVLLAVMLLGNAAASPDTVLAVAVAAYVSIGALLFLRAGPHRVRVRSMSIILMPNTADVQERAQVHAMANVGRHADQGRPHVDDSCDLTGRA